MSTPIITFDCDGVIAGGGYIPREDRRPEVYAALPLLDKSAPDIINDLCQHYGIYIVSARDFEDALNVTKRWLNRNGVDLDWLAGVTCTSIDSKIKILQALNPLYHFDDAPMILNVLSRSSRVLFSLHGSRWLGADEYAKQNRTVRSWQEIQNLLYSYCPNPPALAPKTGVAYGPPGEFR
jgi:5'(3')-deoxyribonucleotidase